MDVFASRPVDPETLREVVPPTLRLQTMSDEYASSIDPVSYEIVRHRLSAITDDMAETMKRTTGSLVVSDANDFNFAICDEVGQEVQLALYNTQLGASIDVAISWILRNRSANPGIAEGDMFLSNDPWVGGGAHQNDVGMFQPIFWEGELFAWSGSVLHALDVGGVTPGGFSPLPEDIFSEPVPTPPFKLVEGFRMRDDLEQLFTRRSRLPGLAALDLRAHYGASVTARRRILELLEDYGADVVKGVMRRMMLDAEQRTRAKLRQLPDGVWHSTQWMDSSHVGDRGLHAVRLRMEKEGDGLVFDFTETDPSAGMINCTLSGARSGVLSALMPLLSGDVPWAPGGLWRCMEMRTRPGTLIDAVFPAAVGKASVAGTMCASMAVVDCLSKMLDTHEQLRMSACSMPAGSPPADFFAGVDEGGVPFVGLIMEALILGLGARRDRDGVDTGGMLCISKGRIPDCEMSELAAPVLYLWRKERPDSGGPGRYRGGCGFEVAIMPRRAGSPFEVSCSSSGKAVPQNPGMAGGYPGGSAFDIIVHKSNVSAMLAAAHIPASMEELEGESEVLPPQAITHMGLDDVLVAAGQGGGGYMDPLLRDTALVARDVVLGKVSLRAARELYGVVLDADARIDGRATVELRASLRTDRESSLVAARRQPAKVDLADASETRLDENLSLVAADGSTLVRCRHCETVVSDDAEHLYEFLPLIEDTVERAGPTIWPTPEDHVDELVCFRQYLCPSCHTALASSVVPASYTAVADVIETGVSVQPVPNA